MDIVTSHGPMAIEAKGTVGATAVAAAMTLGLGLPGSKFTLKADGVLLDPGAKIGEADKAGVLEVVEVSLAESPAAAAG